MISPTDLREGNIIIDYEGNVITVAEIIGNGIYCLENDDLYAPAGIYGYPLRMTILLVCFGFKYLHYENETGFCYTKDDIIIFEHASRMSVFNGTKFLRFVDSLHQLDNILYKILKHETKSLIQNLRMCQSLL